MPDMPLRCACGKVRGVVRGMTPANTNRAICHCDDCQAFVHYLGRADEVLDEHGGTEVLQVQPAKVEFTEGAEHLACLRLTEKGTYRWYAGCCRTPIGNTPANWRISFVGLLRRCVEVDTDVSAAAGPVRMRVFSQFATGDPATMADVPGVTFGGHAPLRLVGADQGAGRELPQHAVFRPGRSAGRSATSSRGRGTCEAGPIRARKRLRVQG